MGTGGAVVREWTQGSLPWEMTKSRVWPWHGVGKDDEVQEVMGLGAHAGSGLCRPQEDAVL